MGNLSYLEKMRLLMFLEIFSLLTSFLINEYEPDALLFLIITL